MAEDINLTQLIINRLTQAQYDELVKNGEIHENELYLTDDSRDLFPVQTDNEGKYLTTDGTSVSWADVVAQGVVEQNNKVVKIDWVGTIEEYEEQKVKETHPDWVCYIVNDEIEADSIIDDEVIGTDTTYSSSKIEALVEESQSDAALFRTWKSA